MHKHAHYRRFSQFLLVVALHTCSQALHTFFRALSFPILPQHAYAHTFVQTHTSSRALHMLWVIVMYMYVCMYLCLLQLWFVVMCMYVCMLTSALICCNVSPQMHAYTYTHTQPEPTCAYCTILHKLTVARTCISDIYIHEKILHALAAASAGCTTLRGGDGRVPLAFIGWDQGMMCVCMYVCMYVCVCVYVCIYVCVGWD